MMTIEENAKAYAEKAWSKQKEFNEDHVTFENIVIDAYSQGVKDFQSLPLNKRLREEEKEWIIDNYKSYLQEMIRSRSVVDLNLVTGKLLAYDEIFNAKFFNEESKHETTN